MEDSKAFKEFMRVQTGWWFFQEEIMLNHSFREISSLKNWHLFLPFHKVTVSILTNSRISSSPHPIKCHLPQLVQIVVLYGETETHVESGLSGRRHRRFREGSLDGKMAAERGVSMPWFSAWPPWFHLFAKHKKNRKDIYLYNQNPWLRDDWSFRT